MFHGSMRPLLQPPCHSHTENYVLIDGIGIDGPKITTIRLIKLFRKNPYIEGGAPFFCRLYSSRWPINPRAEGKHNNPAGLYADASITRSFQPTEPGYSRPSALKLAIVLQVTLQRNQEAHRVKNANRATFYPTSHHMIFHDGDGGGCGTYMYRRHSQRRTLKRNRRSTRAPASIFKTFSSGFPLQGA